jgi:acyl carrier protein
MPSRDEIVARIQRITKEKLDLPPDLGNVDSETLLFKGGLELDSFNVVELISELEAQFAFEFLEADFREEHFRTVGTLGGLVDRYLNG